LGDPRQNNKKAYGEVDGSFIGFMDDLTPCRVKNSTPDRPWFRLNNQFMDVKKNRCFSGPHWGFCASNLDLAKKLFFWYSLARTFLQHPYPMWVDADDMWEPNIPEKIDRTLLQTAFAVGYAENECVETQFPANNPVKGVPGLTVSNPMTPLNSDSFWSKTMRPYCADSRSDTVPALTKCVDKLFADWKKLFKGHTEVPLSRRAYMLDDEGLKVGAGIAQIGTMQERQKTRPSADWSGIQKLLTSTKNEFFDLITSEVGVNYFGAKKKAASSVSAGKNGTSKALAKPPSSNSSPVGFSFLLATTHGSECPASLRVLLTDMALAVHSTGIVTPVRDPPG